MNYDQLFQLACRRAFVRWFPSGIVERLRVATSTQHPNRSIVLAENILVGKEHPIRPFRGQMEFYCNEVAPEELVRLGDLLPKDRRY